MTADSDADDLGTLRGGAMDREEIDAILTEQGVGVLSLAADGIPYGIPMSFGYDGTDKLYILFVGHSEEGRKVRYAEQSETASFLVFDVDTDGGWQSAIVAGELRRITPDDWDAAREAMADNAYRPQLLTSTNISEDPRVWVLDAEEMSGRAIGE